LLAISLTAIFGEATEKECITHRHLCNKGTFHDSVLTGVLLWLIHWRWSLARILTNFTY